MKVTVRIERREGGPIDHRVSEDHLVMNLMGDWLVINEKTGRMDVNKRDILETKLIVPIWNVIGVEISGAAAEPSFSGRSS